MSLLPLLLLVDDAAAATATATATVSLHFAEAICCFNLVGVCVCPCLFFIQLSNARWRTAALAVGLRLIDLNRRAKMFTSAADIISLAMSMPMYLLEQVLLQDEFIYLWEYEIAMSSRSSE